MVVKSVRVPPCGPPGAKLAIVGMAPGMQEEVEGKPFVGAAGRLLDFVLSKMGVVRSEVYITNVSKYMPPGHNLKRLKEVGVSLDEQVKELFAELRQVKPNCILALGDDALHALTSRMGILNWRGSVLESSVGKVVASIHPAAIIRSGHIAIKDEDQTRQVPMLPMLLFDVKRWVQEGEFKELNRHPRTTLLNPTIEQVQVWAQRLMVADKIALDIETSRGEVSCIGFCDTPTEAICVPFDTGTGNYWSTQQEEEDAWYWIIQVLKSPARKIIQNALFELQFLGGFDGIKNVWWDTMLAQHVLYPELPKRLSFLTSLYTDVPYYKWRGREWRPGDPPEELWEYNGLDCMTTFEIQGRQEQELREVGLSRVFHGIVMPQIYPIHEIQTHGLLTDLKVMTKIRKEREHKLVVAQQTLDDLSGAPLNTNSPKQMREFLFGKMGLPKPRLKRGSKEVSTDEATLEKLALKHPSPVFDLILAIREQRKAISTYLNEEKIDQDQRMRSSFRIGGTETGRMSSGRNIWKRGLNQQNIPKPFRKMFVADPGRVLMEADGAQAEARLVAWEARETRLKDIFKSGQKVHSVVASLIFEKPIDQLSLMEYDLGKRTVHGANYGMQAGRFVEVAKKNGGLTITEQRAQWLLERYHAIFPNIRGVYHKKVQDALRTTRTLVTCWGRRRVFSGMMGEELFKEGYAYLAQSAIADWLNLSLCRCYWRMIGEGLDVMWLGQIHDAFLLSPLKKDVERCKVIIREEAEQPFKCNDDPIYIPVDIKVGDNWYEMN